MFLNGVKKTILTNNKDANVAILSKLAFEDLREVLTVNKATSKFNNDILWRNYLSKKEDFEAIKSVIKRPWKEFALLLEKYHIKDRKKHEGCEDSSIYVTNRMIYFPIKDGHHDLVEYFIPKIYFRSWNWYVYHAAKGVHLDLVKWFLSKFDDHDWDWYMHPALVKGHKHVVEFFISQGVNNWDAHLQSACEGGNLDLVELMIEKGATNFNAGMYGAAKGNNLHLVEYCIAKGANNWKIASYCAHSDLVPFFEQKMKEQNNLGSKA